MKTKSSHNHHHHLDYFFDVVIFQSFLFRSLFWSFPPAVRLSAVWAQGWDQGFSVRVNSCASVAAGLVTSIDESKVLRASEFLQPHVSPHHRSEVSQGC